MQRFLGLVVALVVGGTFAVVVANERAPERGSTLSVETRVRPAPGQSRITGQVTGLDAAVSRPTSTLPTPFTISVATPKGQAVRLAPVDVGGVSSTVLWDGGRPLPVSGGPGLDLGELRVVIEAAGITWHLDGAPRPLLPGTYRLGVTVAVAGPRGLATSRDQVALLAGANTILVSQADAVVRTEPRAIRILGPGSFTMTGSFVVDDGKQVRSLTTGRFAGGAYDVELVPNAGGYRITATVDGRIEG
ncbi:MAG TPA: hypothetical protein VMY34_06220 [Acidimicrobiales bacterium]|nr:hypothetical protein [Acidimicrobiales bacterium]